MAQKSPFLTRLDMFVVIMTFEPISRCDMQLLLMISLRHVAKGWSSATLYYKEQQIYHFGQTCYASSAYCIRGCPQRDCILLHEHLNMYQIEKCLEWFAMQKFDAKYSVVGVLCLM